MKQLIVTADDFGYTCSVNEGIAFAWEHSPVGEVSALVNAAASEHAFELARKHKISNIGFHLNLDMGKPLTKCSSLAPGGSFRKLLSEKELFDALTAASASEVEKEILAQFDAFVAGFGRKPTHISSHHAVHADKKVLDVCIRLCKQYKIPLRLPVAMANTITFVQNYSGEVMVKRAV